MGGGRELSPEMNYMVRMIALENQRLQQELELMRGSVARLDRKAFLLDKFKEVSCRLWEVVKRLDLTGGSVLQAAERVGLSLVGIAGVVTDKWTCGGGGSNVKSNLLQLGLEITWGGGK